MALHFGADAVYLAGAQFGMRAGAENFTPDGIRAAVQLAHAQGAAVHVTCNTLPRDDEMVQLPAYLELLDDAGVDAIIAADLCVITLAKRYAPHVALHVSTQFGVVNSAAAAALLSFCAASEPQPASPAIMVPAISRESAFLLQFLFISNLLCFIVLYVAIF